jgi:hypothetical protein
VRYAWLFTPVFAMLLDGDESFASSVPAALVGTGGGGGSLGGGSGGCGGAFPQPGAPAAKRSLAKSGSFLDCTPTPDPYSQLAQAGAPRQSWPGGWPGSHPPAGAPASTPVSSRTCRHLTLWRTRSCPPAARGAATPAQSRTRQALRPRTRRSHRLHRPRRRSLPSRPSHQGRCPSRPSLSTCTSPA